MMKTKTIKRSKSKSRKMLTRNNKSRKNKQPILMRKGGEPRRSTRRQDKLDIATYPLAGESTRINMQDKDILDFINNSIKPNTPVMITLPVYPERHAFIVLVLENKKKIMVADWGERDIDQIQEEVLKNPDWKGWVIYAKFMKLLKNKYHGYKLEFFPVDKELYKEASAHHNKYLGKGDEKEEGSGGCSYYIYEWKSKHDNELKNLINPGSAPEELEEPEEPEEPEELDEPVKMTKRSKPEEPEEHEVQVKRTRRSKPEEPEEHEVPVKRTRRSKPEEPEEHEVQVKRTRRSGSWFW